MVLVLAIRHLTAVTLIAVVIQIAHLAFLLIGKPIIIPIVLEITLAQNTDPFLNVFQRVIFSNTIRD